MIDNRMFVVLLMMLVMIFVALLASVLVAWLNIKGFNASLFFDRFGDMTNDATKLKRNEDYLNANE